MCAANTQVFKYQPLKRGETLALRKVTLAAPSIFKGKRTRIMEGQLNYTRDRITPLKRPMELPYPKTRPLLAMKMSYSMVHTIPSPSAQSTK